MISLWQMQRKAIGFTDRPVWRRVPCSRGPLGPSGDLRGPSSSRPLDRVRKSPRHQPHAPGRSGLLLRRGRPLGPLRALASLWRPYIARRGPIAPLTPLAPLGRHRPTCAPISPRGPEGGRRAAMANQSSARGSRPRNRCGGWARDFRLGVRGLDVICDRSISLLRCGGPLEKDSGLGAACGADPMSSQAYARGLGYCCYLAVRRE
jgi:hypothetical protein